ncbi:MAG: hypothetical protein QM690_13960, partial [Sphingobium sp.]
FSARWITGGANAATLALGRLLGTRMAPGGPVGQAGGRLVAQGTLDRALTTQLAAADARPVRILLSLENGGGQYCRVFETGAMAGLACRDGDRWAIERVQSGGAQATGQYRQAGSPLEEIMAAAQAMTAGGALDPGQEKAALEKGWRR